MIYRQNIIEFRALKTKDILPINQYLNDFIKKVLFSTSVKSMFQSLLFFGYR